MSVGDCVRFTWSGLHGVWKLPSDVCEFGSEGNGRVELAAAQDGGTYDWIAREAGELFLACPVSGHCEAGMLIQATVS